MRSVDFSVEFWEIKTPFRITGHTFNGAEMLYVSISENGQRGHGEATGVYYLGETASSMLAQAESIRSQLEQGASRQQLLDLLPAGGARNAIDCALWDLEAKQAGTRIWTLTGIVPGQIISVNTVGLGSPEEMAANARTLNTPRLKVKLSDDDPLARITAVREARPDAQIIVDVNQGWSFAQLTDLAPKLRTLAIAMIEQPLPRGADEELQGYKPPVPLCADESCLDTSEFEQAAQRYQMINIKLDKTGGLTEALELAQMAIDHDMGIMVGNMLGTSLAMAPGYVIAQMCQYVDLDGALFLKQDREPAMHFKNGILSAPEPGLWG
jgi:L-alanine-DL-glutamate epimerase-like enolase superfamily enzyme